MNQKKKHGSELSQNRELVILKKIVDITTSDFNLDWILKEIIKIVNDVTRADSVLIYLFNPQRDALVLMASKIPHESMLGKINLKLGEGITGWVARENKLVAINHKAYLDPRFKNLDNLPEDKYEAFLSIPIVYQGSTIGVINIQHKQPHLHDSQMINLISTISKQVGGVIENARLYKESKEKASRFDSLIKVTQSISSEHYLDEILDLIVIVTAEMFDSKICSIMLLDPKGAELIMKATQSLSREYKNKPNVRVDKSLSGQVIKNKRPMSVYDVRKNAQYFYRDLAIKEELTSMLAVPMVVREKAIGIINIYTKKHHHFVREEIDVLQLIANQSAVAVENTKLMGETLKARESLETRNLIEQAKRILMTTNHFDEETAYKLIHKKSMDSGRSMKDIAESFILLSEIRNKN